tara:strand:- start:110 stop:508 length:399 start_codon:yes stop_codon:yes gene_type:complete
MLSIGRPSNKSPKPKHPYLKRKPKNFSFSVGNFNSGTAAVLRMDSISLCDALITRSKIKVSASVQGGGTSDDSVFVNLANKVGDALSITLPNTASLSTSRNATVTFTITVTTRNVSSEPITVTATLAPRGGR